MGKHWFISSKVFNSAAAPKIESPLNPVYTTHLMERKKKLDEMIDKRVSEGTSAEKKYSRQYKQLFLEFLFRNGTLRQLANAGFYTSTHWQTVFGWFRYAWYIRADHVDPVHCLLKKMSVYTRVHFVMEWKVNSDGECESTVYAGQVGILTIKHPLEMIARTKAAMAALLYFQDNKSLLFYLITDEVRRSFRSGMFLNH